MKSVRTILSGLAALAILTVGFGCGSKEDAPANGSDATSAPAKTEEHVHGSGPHGGTIADWGGGAYHVEFTVDHGKKEATVYVLGDDQKTPAPIKTPKVLLIINDPATELELLAQPLEGEAEGVSSRFVGTHDNIGIVKEFEGTITADVDGTPYTGDFKEEPHGAEHKP